MATGLPASPPAARLMGDAQGATLAAGRSLAGEAEPETLVLSYWFESGESGDEYDTVVRLVGRLAGTGGAPVPGESFVRDEVIRAVIPGTGAVAVTTLVAGLAPGAWEVDAELVQPGSGNGSRAKARSGTTESVHLADWSWRRWRLLPGDAATPIATRWALLAPLAARPGVLPGIYPVLAVVGFVLALALQAVILTATGLPFGEPFVASVLALVAGLIGAKAWYAVLHPDEPVMSGGWAVDGFLVVAPLALAVLLIIRDLPVGATLDATAPGIFFAVAIGRIGCFLTGCCAGRPTNSRWGVWSSDRRIGTRRIPTQLIESGIGLGIGVLALQAALAGGLVLPGAAFLLFSAFYAAARQVLLRLRAEQRRSYRTLPLTAAAAGALVPVIGLLLVLQGA